MSPPDTRVKRGSQRPLRGRGTSTSGAAFAGLIHGGLSLICATLCVVLAWNHPLSGPLALLICGALALLSAWQPLAGLALLPVALPAIGLMPWTGWLTFEELDLAVLAVAAGAYARRDLCPPPPATAAAGATVLKGLLVAGYSAALIISMTRGFADAGGYAWGWWQGYHEPMNSVRVAKSFFLAMLLAPLWRIQLRAAPERAAQWLGFGLAGGLLMVALLALWERWAHTGLGNFSSDYRGTALFWEMHVGGAAFDGFLVLTMPFAVRELLRPAAPWRWALAAAAVVLGTYACLTTFSRAVYLAVPVGLIAMAVLLALAARRMSDRPGAPAAAAGGAAAWVIGAAFTAAAVAIFPTSGYRGMLTLFGAVALLLPMAAALRRMPARGWVVGAAAGLALSLLLTLLAYLLPKGPYVVYALAWVAGAVTVLWGLWRSPTSPVSWWGAPMWTAWLTVLASMLLVATHWGGERALAPMAVVVVLLLAVAMVGGRGRTPRWPESHRWQGSVLGALAALTLTVGVLFGGAYMSDRFATGSRDLDGRLQHWSAGLSLLNDPLAWAFGKGTGRYPANHFLSGRTKDQVGDYRLREEGGARYLALTGGKHPIDWGELFRISQRVGSFTGPVTVKADVRSAMAAGLHFEICRKHLLYDDGGCMINVAPVKAQAGTWQSLVLQLPGQGLSSGDFFAPHFVTFSVAVNTSGRLVELDNLSARDASGRELLANGDFSSGMARWFFSSDRHHLPWHMKNIFLHVLFEQGWIGLGLFSGLVVLALWRVSVGTARDYSLSPALGAAVLGFLVVGLFDSLLDAPRVAFLFYLLLAVALELPGRSAMGESQTRLSR